ncbi:MAG TPA: MGMT family protein [Rugosimonospora sp.]
MTAAKRPPDRGTPSLGAASGPEAGDFVEDVLSLVERIPPGRVMSYGAIADYVGRGGPRQVGAVMSHYGASVPWYRVVTAAGRTPPGHEETALRRLRADGTALRGERVDMRTAAWYPDDEPPPDSDQPGSDRPGSDE